MDKTEFQKNIWSFYRAHGRDFPWRNTRDPYKILVSEFMLQQTGVERVLQKYPIFLKKFPSVEALAEAPFSDVFALWQGLGYNRRARYLKGAGEAILSRFEGKIPQNRADLLSLPGIGPSTAGAVLAFAYNIAEPFIETNIRRVYLYSFFPRARRRVGDKTLIKLVSETMDRDNPREWYFALYDYGAHLGKNLKKNPNTKSRHYSIQSKFEGSNRQVRGEILKALSHTKTPYTFEDIKKNIKHTKNLKQNLESLEKEGLVTKNKRGVFTL